MSKHKNSEVVITPSNLVNINHNDDDNKKQMEGHEKEQRKDNEKEQIEDHKEEQNKDRKENQKEEQDDRKQDQKETRKEEQKEDREEEQKKDHKEKQKGNREKEQREDHKEEQKGNREKEQKEDHKEEQKKNREKEQKEDHEEKQKEKLEENQNKDKKSIPLFNEEPSKSCLSSDCFDKSDNFDDNDKQPLDKDIRTLMDTDPSDKGKQNILVTLTSNNDDGGGGRGGGGGTGGGRGGDGTGGDDQQFLSGNERVNTSEDSAIDNHSFEPEPMKDRTPLTSSFSPFSSVAFSLPETQPLIVPHQSPPELQTPTPLQSMVLNTLPATTVCPQLMAMPSDEKIKCKIIRRVTSTCPDSDAATLSKLLKYTRRLMFALDELRADTSSTSRKHRDAIVDLVYRVQWLLRDLDMSGETCDRLTIMLEMYNGYRKAYFRLRNQVDGCSKRSQVYVCCDRLTKTTVPSRRSLHPPPPSPTPIDLDQSDCDCGPHAWIGRTNNEKMGRELYPCPGVTDMTKALMNVCPDQYDVSSETTGSEDQSKQNRFLEFITMIKNAYWNCIKYQFSFDSCPDNKN